MNCDECDALGNQYLAAIANATTAETNLISGPQEHFLMLAQASDKAELDRDIAREKFLSHKRTHPY